MTRTDLVPCLQNFIVVSPLADPEGKPSQSPLWEICKIHVCMHLYMCKYIYIYAYTCRHKIFICACFMFWISFSHFFFLWSTCSQSSLCQIFLVWVVVIGIQKCCWFGEGCLEIPVSQSCISHFGNIHELNCCKWKVPHSLIVLCCSFLRAC